MYQPWRFARTYVRAAQAALGGLASRLQPGGAAAATAATDAIVQEPVFVGFDGCYVYVSDSIGAWIATQRAPSSAAAAEVGVPSTSSTHALEHACAHGAGLSSAAAPPSSALSSFVGLRHTLSSAAFHARHAAKRHHAQCATSRCKRVG